MNGRRTSNRATRLWIILALITLLLLAATPLVHPFAAPAHVGMRRSAGGTWANQLPAAAPSARDQCAMASVGRDQVLLFGGWDGINYLGDTWVYDLSDNTWTNMAPAVAPSARRSHAMAYLGDDQVLLFGGWNDASNGDTWVYDLSDNTWTNKNPAAAPFARSSHAMAYLGGDQVLLFGGFVDYWGQTWVYDLSDNTWTEKEPATAPSPRLGHALAYLGGDRVLLFGGQDGMDSGTWVYDLSDNIWTSQGPAAGPPARYDHAMASLGGDQALLFGGWNGANYLGDTWVYDLSDNTWTSHALVSSRTVVECGAACRSAAEWTAVSPSARARQAMALIGGDRVLLFGGDTASSYSAETWLAAGFRDNQPPVADAGSDQTVRTLALVTLDGSGSADPDGDLPLAYFWTQAGGPAVTLGDPTVVTPTFSAPGDTAVLTFTLTVTDSLGLPASVPDEVVITVQPYRVYLPVTMCQAQFGGGVRGAVVRTGIYPD